MLVGSLTPGASNAPPEALDAGFAATGNMGSRHGRLPLAWIIGWGARFQARLSDEDASAATSAEIGEAPRSEPGDAAHAALHAAGHISGDEFTLIGGPPSPRQAGRRPVSPYPRLTSRTPRHGPAREPGRGFRGRRRPHPGPAGDYLDHGQCSIKALTTATMIVVRGASHQRNRGVAI